MALEFQSLPQLFTKTYYKSLVTYFWLRWFRVSTLTGWKNQIVHDFCLRTIVIWKSSFQLISAFSILIFNICSALHTFKYVCDRKSCYRREITSESLKQKHTLNIKFYLHAFKIMICDRSWIDLQRWLIYVY